jgi:hypothetical protein
MEVETWTWRHEDGDVKWKTEAQAILLYLFTIANHKDRRLLFFCFLTQKQAEVNRLQTINKLNELAHLGPSHKNTFLEENHFVNKIGIHRTLTSKHQKWIAWKIVQNHILIQIHCFSAMASSLNKQDFDRNQRYSLLKKNPIFCLMILGRGGLHSFVLEKNTGKIG